MNNRKSPDRPLKAGERRRTFTDDEGVFWDVRETSVPAYDRRGGLCLIFESANAIRRVRNYPPEWFEWSDDDLAELSRHA